MDDYQQFNMSSNDDSNSCDCGGSGCLSFIIALVMVFGVIGGIVLLFT